MVNRRDASEKKRDRMNRFEKLITEIVMSGRLINGMTLSQLLAEGKIKYKNILVELLNMDRKGTLDVLNADDVDGFVNLLNLLFSKDHCAGDGKPCEDFVVIVTIATEMQKVGENIGADYGSILADGGVLDGFDKLIIAYKKVGECRKDVDKLIENFQNNDNLNNEDQDILGGNIKNGIRDLKKHMQQLQAQLNEMSSDLLTQKKLVDELNKIVGLETVESSFKNGSLQPLQDKLKILEALADITKPHLSKENRSKMVEITDVMFSVNHSPKLSVNEKNLTPAFYNGASDFAKLFKDVEDSFVYTLLLPGLKKERLKTLFASLAKLNEQINPLHKALQQHQNLIGVKEKMMKLLADVDEELDVVDRNKPLLKCVQGVAGFKVEIDIEKWKTEKTHALRVGDHATSFLEKGKNTTMVLPKMIKFGEDIYDSDNIKVYMNVKNSTNAPNVPNVIGELTNYGAELDGVLSVNISDWMENTKLNKLNPEAKKWFGNSEVTSPLACLQNKTIFETAINDFTNRVYFAAIKKLNEDNEFYIILKSAAGNLKTVVSEWKKLQKTFQSRSVRSADEIPKFENALEVLKNLSDALKGYHDLVIAYASIEDIQALVKAEDAINAAINKLTDPEQKKKIKKLWNKKTIKTLSSIPAMVDKLNKAIPSSPKKREEFAQIFKTSVTFEEMESFDMPTFVDFIQSIDMTLLDPGLAERLRPLQMDFANAHLKNPAGLKAFLLTLPWFAALSPESQKTMLSKYCKDCTTGGIVLAVLVSATLLGIAFSGVSICCGSNPINWCKYLTSCGKKAKKAKDLEIGHTPNNGDKAHSGANPKNDVKVAWTVEKTPNAQKLTETTCFKPSEGDAFMKPASNASITGTEICMEDEESEKNKKPAPQVIEPAQMAQTADQKKKMNKLKEDLEVYGKDQKFLRAAFRKGPDRIEYFEFRHRTTGQIKAIHSRVFDDKTKCAKGDVAHNLPNIKYVVGYQHDKFEKPNKNQEEANKGRKEISDRLRTARHTFTTEDDTFLNSTKTAGSIADESIRIRKKYSSAKVLAVLKKTDSAVTQETQSTVEERADGGKNKDKDGNDLEEDGLDEFERNIRDDIVTYWNPPLEKILPRYEKEINAADAEWLQKKPRICYTESEFFKGDLFLNEEKTELDYTVLQQLLTTRDIVYFDEFRKKHTDILSLLPLQALTATFEKASVDFKNDDDVLGMNREKIRFIGDTHGHYDDFARQVELGMDDVESSYLFQGDYVDRGTNSLLILITICTLKINCPSRYHFLRGNHELPQINAPNGFLEECVRNYGKKDGQVVWEAAIRLFKTFPVGSLAQGSIWCAHGGLSALMVKGMDWVKKNLKKEPGTKPQWQCWVDVLWADPDERFMLSATLAKCFPVSEGRSKFAHLMTPQGVEKVFKRCGITTCVRGHQVPEAGFEQHYTFKIFTTFGATNNNNNNLASQLIITKNLEANIVLFSKPENPDDSKADDLMTSADELGVKTESDDSKKSKSSSVPKISTGSSSFDRRKKFKVSKSSPGSKGSTTSNASNTSKPGQQAKKSSVLKKKAPTRAPSEVQTHAPTKKNTAQSKTTPGEGKGNGKGNNGKGAAKK